MDRDTFIIDLEDPEDVVAKFQVAQDRVTELRRELTKWEARATFLCTQLPIDDREHPRGEEAEQARVEPPRPEPPASAEETPAATGTNTGIGELAVSVINTAGRPVRSVWVCRQLEQQGHDVTPTMISNALHYAARTGKLQKWPKGRGVYAPADYHEHP